MLYILAILVLIAPLLWLKIRLMKDIRRQKADESAFSSPTLETAHSVASLSILPLVEYHGADETLATEAGVSYLIKAGDMRILLDVGANEGKTDPSPLLANAQRLGVDLSTIDALFLSHLHRDHVGGIAEEKGKYVSISRGEHPVRDICVYTPEPLTGPLPRGCEAITVTAPVEIAPGIWSMGPMGRALCLMGYIQEQALAIHVKGKGMALIIGCGHPTIERLLARCQGLFPHPIFAVIGGLHYPIHGGRMMMGPINIQRLVGSDRMPGWGLGEAEVRDGIAALKRAGVGAVGISPHDSCDWTLDQFRQAFKGSYHEVAVGHTIELAPDID